MDSFTREWLTVLVENTFRRVDRLLDRLDPPTPSSEAQVGPQSPPTTAAPMKDSHSDAERCPICHNHLEGGHCPVCHLGALEPESSQESTEAATPPSQPSGQPTTTSPAELRYVSVRCPACAAWLRIDLIPALDVPASPTE
jgi:hypothetical protein